MKRPRGVASHAWEAVPSYRPGHAKVAGALLPRLVTNAESVWRATSDIHAAPQEHLIALDLDVRHRIIARRVVAIGSLTGVEVHPREVFRQAIVNGAAAIILVHNHPSGNPDPSRQDIVLTERLCATGDICGIAILDHVVVTVDGYTSIPCPPGKAFS